ncbi:DNA-binding domain-containing protein [Enterobacter sp. FR 78]|uniref:conjugal transfer nickase/helicase domain-containing protein n=1 Tax=Enterobacter sp. FR 78 TaxID=3021714 RepID=UPI0023A9852D|nr:DNA-binding domain-containing protein [Enterobacter sp. FR 78]MDD9578963.1 DNA-binding domain-containing protein [Enterobacter sp. FR 78]
MSHDLTHARTQFPQKKSSQLKGFLMEDPGLVLGEKVPVNNPWLKLVPAQE